LSGRPYPLRKMQPPTSGQGLLELPTHQPFGVFMHAQRNQRAAACGCKRSVWVLNTITSQAMQASHLIYSNNTTQDLRQSQVSGDLAAHCNNTWCQARELRTGAMLSIHVCDDRYSDCGDECLPQTSRPRCLHSFTVVALCPAVAGFRCLHSFTSEALCTAVPGFICGDA